MNALLRRLREDGYDFSFPSVDRKSTWNFSQELNEKGVLFFQKMAEQHLALNFEYSVHCTRIAHKLSNAASHQDNLETTINDIQAALMLAEALEHLYQHYLMVPREVTRLRKDQEVYRSLLSYQGFRFNDQNKTPVQLTQKISSKDIRDYIAEGNWPRFLIIRSRRFFLSMLPFFNELGRYHRVVKGIDAYLAPVLSYVAWLYFIPRLFINLFLLAMHAIPGAWMGAEQKKLGWKLRCYIQLSRKWFELANDVVWFLGGLIGCFILTGGRAGFAPYFTVILQAYDVLLATIRLYVEMGQIQQIKNQYLGILKQYQNELSTIEREEIFLHLGFLNKRSEHEERRFYLGILNNLILLLALSAAVPALAFHPLVPFLAAVIILLDTVGTYMATKLLEKNKPVDKVSYVELPKMASPTLRVSAAPTFFKISPSLKPRVAPVITHLETMGPLFN